MRIHGLYLVLLCATSAHAQSRTLAPARGAASPEGLADAYVIALRASDTAAESALMHPAYRRCASSSDAVYQRGTRRFMDSVRVGKLGGPYKVLVRDVKDSMDFGGIFEPVRPTKQLQIAFPRDFALLRRVAPVSGRWFIVLPCLTPEELEKVHARAGHTR